jgi:hypothetical protein
MIKDVSEYRKLHIRATTVSAAAVTAAAAAATAAARAASASLARSTGKNLLAAPVNTHPQMAGAAAAAAVAALAAQGSSSSSGLGGKSHAELLESCCVAVLKMQVRPSGGPLLAAWKSV